jgi:hypothetical protein
MHSLTPEFLDALRFDCLQIATLRALGEFRGKQQLFVAQSPQVLQGLTQIAVIESTESSNRLEGVTVAPARLKSLMSKNADPKSRSEQEIAGFGTLCHSSMNLPMECHFPKVFLDSYIVFFTAIYLRMVVNGRR